MAFRLLFWRRPRDAGRHARATALAVPDSTGTVVAPPEAAAPAYVVDLEATAPVPVVAAIPPDRGAVPAPSDSQVTAPATTLEPPAASGPSVGTPAPDAGSAPPDLPRAAPVGATAVAPVGAVPQPADVAVAGVALGFADGASVELHPDDPRVSSFRAAAAALLDPRSG